MARKSWDACDAIERAREVKELYLRGLTVHAIAKHLRTHKVSEVQHYHDLIIRAGFQEGFVEDYLSDVQSRRMEQIRALDAQLDELYHAMDYCKENIAITNEHGAPLREVDPKTGQLTGEILFQMRDSKLFFQCLKQAEVVSSEKADLLRLNAEHVDLTVKLQLSQQMQQIIIEKIKALAPDIYAQIYREISAIGPENLLKLSGPTVEAKYTIKELT